MTLEEFVKKAEEHAREQREKERREALEQNYILRRQQIVNECGRDGVFPYQGHYVAIKNGVLICHEDTKGAAMKEYDAFE